MGSRPGGGSQLGEWGVRLKEEEGGKLRRKRRKCLELVYVKVLVVWGDVSCRKLHTIYHNWQVNPDSLSRIH